MGLPLDRCLGERGRGERMGLPREPCSGLNPNLGLHPTPCSELNPGLSLNPVGCSECCQLPCAVYRLWRMTHHAFRC